MARNMIRKLKVLYRTYKVDWSAERALQFDQDVGTQHSGGSDHAKLIVHIAPNAVEQNNRETLVHEILHCALNTSGADQAIEGLEQYEEKIICVLAPTLLTILQDNKKLVEYLMEDDK